MTTVAVIGAGNWGKNHVRVFANLPQVKLKYVCDADAKKNQALQLSYPQVEFVTSAERVFADAEVEGVVIASSAVSHYPLAKAALLAGKDVLVEKPLTLDSASAAELVGLVEKTKGILMVGHLLIYHPALDKLKALVDSGELGDIYYIYTQRVNLGIIRRDENALWSFAPHDISIILHLLGKQPVSVVATGASYIQPNIEDVVFVTLKFAGSQIAHTHLSWLDPYKIRRVTVVGSRKMAVFDDEEASEKIKVYDKGVNGLDYTSYGEAISLRFGDILIPRIVMTEPLRREAEHFVHCIRTRQKPKTDGESGLQVVQILEAAQNALLSKRGST